MRHPFDGILGQPEPAVPEPTADSATRRSFFGKMFAIAAGAAALFGGRTYAQESQGQSGSNWGAIDPGRNGTNPSEEQMTTQALGEEGAGFPPPTNDAPVTTYALGEEGNYTPPTTPPGYATTYALGEEAGYYPPPRRGYYYRRPWYARRPWYGYRPPYYHGGRYTTQALGEEGGY